MGEESIASFCVYVHQSRKIDQYQPTRDNRYQYILSVYVTLPYTYGTYPSVTLAPRPLSQVL